MFSYQRLKVSKESLETLTQIEDLQFYDYSSSRVGGGRSKHPKESLDQRIFSCSCIYGNLQTEKLKRISEDQRDLNQTSLS